jgi:hypothetical protein
MLVRLVHFGMKQPYSVTFHRVTLPKSQVTILDDVDGKEGFSYIRIPFINNKKSSKI